MVSALNTETTSSTPSQPLRFNGVKVFSATMLADRERLGVTVKHLADPRLHRATRPRSRYAPKVRAVYSPPGFERALVEANRGRH